MLTKEDLQEIAELLRPLEKKLDEVDNRLKFVEDDTKNIRLDVRKLDKKVDLISDTLDRDLLRLQKRVKLIENNLNLPDMFD